MFRLPVLIALVVAVALASGACAYVSPLAYLSVNRAAAPLADGKSVSATVGSGSAASAAVAVPTGIDLSTKTIDLTASSKTTIDLTGSWLVWTPFRFNQTASGGWNPAALKPEWACPSGTWAWFESADIIVAPISDIIAVSMGGLQTLLRQVSAQSKPFTYGLQCAKAFDGKTLTLDTPALPKSKSKVTWLFVSTTTSALQPWLFHQADGTTLESSATGMPIQATSWMRVNLKEAEPVASVAPTARVVARSAPTWVAGGAFSDSRTLWYEVDARQSTDPAGSALSYSWDLDGDGAYGDVSAMPDPPGAALPSGVAIIPVATLDAAAVDGRDITVGVKVTNAAGQVSTAATTTVHPLPNQSYADNYRSDFTLDTATPTVGGTITLTLETPMNTGGYGCVDADGDGVYETTVTLPYRSGAPLSTATTTTTALAAGPHLVTVVFIQRYGGATCANPTADSQALTFRQVYTSGTTRSGGVHGSTRATGYSAATSIRLSKGKTLRASSKSPQTMRLDGSVFGGRYQWSIPQRGNGTARPGALGAFASGAYVARAGQMTVVGGAASEVGMGTGTILLRGAGSADLLCVTAASPGPVQKTVIVGGTGAGARLHGTLTGSGFMMPYDAIGLIGVTGTGKHLQPEFGQVKPFSNTATLTASSGAARKLPKACRALAEYLPGENGGGGSATPSVVTG